MPKLSVDEWAIKKIVHLGDYPINTLVKVNETGIEFTKYEGGEIDE